MNLLTYISIASAILIGTCLSETLTIYEIPRMDDQQATVNSWLQAYLDTGLFGIAKVALEAGADLNLTDAQGNSLLHQAAVTNNVNATKILLEEGGMNVDHRNGLGQTP